MELSPLGAHRLGDLLERQTGQHLGDNRRWLLATALRPVLARFGLASLDALAAQVAADGAGPLATAAVEALLNNETSFFRDRAIFTLLDEQVLPALQAARTTTRRLRIWSAACATGQELQSLAMLVDDGGPRWDGWRVELVGSDVSAAAVATARAGRYTQFEVQRGLAVTELLRHLEPEGDAWRVRAALAARCRFAVHNLLDPPPGRFDLVLCRNVLLYFPPAARAQVFARLEAALAPDGVLILGAGETVLGQTDAFRPDGTWRGCYRRRPLPAAAAPAFTLGPAGAMAGRDARPHPRLPVA